MTECSIVEPVRMFLRGQAEFIEAKCTKVDFVNQTIECVGSTSNTLIIPYDYLVIGVGALTNTFGVKGVKVKY